MEWVRGARAFIARGQGVLGRQGIGRSPRIRSGLRRWKGGGERKEVAERGKRSGRAHGQRERGRSREGSVGRSDTDSGSGGDPWAELFRLGLGRFLIKRFFPFFIKTEKENLIWENKSNPNLAIIYIKMIRELNAI